MDELEGVTPSTNIRRYKSLFRYSSIKGLKRARQDSKKFLKGIYDPNSVTKALKFSKWLLERKIITIECVIDEVRETPPLIFEIHEEGGDKEKVMGTMLAQTNQLILR
jgi:hypothetical protein